MMVTSITAGRILRRAALVLGLFAVAMTAWAGDAPTKVAVNTDAFSARREAAEQRRITGNLYQFKHKDGSITFTNRPTKYKDDGDYIEQQIKYERISVPKEYQSTKTKPVLYTSGAIGQLIKRYAAVYQVEEALIAAVIKAESNYQPTAVSKAGACGLMQLMPGTAAEMGVTDIFDPAQNIAGGAQYLAKMLEIFEGNIDLALAGYNAGPQAVKNNGGIPPYAETQSYVRIVKSYLQSYKKGGYSTTDFRQMRGTPTPSKTITIATAKTDAKKFVVHFHSGLTQPADSVVDKDPYYYIQYGNRTYPVRKDLVKKIDEPA